jgi:hypothetical protein
MVVWSLRVVWGATGDGHGCVAHLVQTRACCALVACCCWLRRALNRAHSCKLGGTLAQAASHITHPC